MASYEHYDIEIDLMTAITGFLAWSVSQDRSAASWKQVNETVTLSHFHPKLVNRDASLSRAEIFFCLFRMLLSTSLILKCTPPPWSSQHGRILLCAQVDCV